MDISNSNEELNVEVYMIEYSPFPAFLSLNILHKYADEGKGEPRRNQSSQNRTGS